MMLGVFWGWPVDGSGRQTGEGAPSLGYWRKSELNAEASREVVSVGGVNLIFGVAPEYRDRFKGKILDFAPERAFFLRTP